MRENWSRGLQAALARLEALEKDNAGLYESIDLDDDEEASMDDEEQSQLLVSFGVIPMHDEVDDRILS